MTIAWGTLGVVALVSAAVAIAVVALLSFAIVGFSARVRPPVGGPDDGAPPPLRSAVGTTVAVVCLCGVALIVGYGLFLIVA